jgi:aspartyl protease family protein
MRTRSEIRRRRIAAASALALSLVGGLPAEAQTKRFLVYDGQSYPPDQLPLISRSPAIYAPPGLLQNGNDYYVPRARDLHAYIPGNINGHPVVFLVDTGASTTVVPPRVAHNAGIRAAIEVEVETAAGKRKAGASEGNAITVGVFAINDVKILVQEGLAQPLLGADVLSRFVITQSERGMLIRRAASR